MVRAVPQLALAFIRTAEACRLDAYQDSAGVWTIGYGHTGHEVVGGLGIDRRQARLWLAEDAQQAAESLAGRLDPGVASELSEHQYAALVSLVFNVGASPRWTLWKVINAREFDQAPGQIIRFDKVRTADGHLRTLSGLTHRRAAEVMLWNTPDAAMTAGPPDNTPPSSETRAADTPPSPALVPPLTRGGSFGAAVAMAAAAIPIAVEAARSGASAVTAAVQPYAERSPLLQQALSALAVVCAALAVASVVLQFLQHHKALRA